LHDEKEKNMSNILIAYATAAGSTAQVAEAIGKTLRQGGATVDVRRAQEVDDLSGYDAVVLGSGVRAGRTYAQAGAFLATHRAALSALPVAGFVVCLAAKDRSEASCAEAEGYLDAMFAQAPGVEPLSKGVFAGAIDYARLPWLLGVILKLLKKEPGGDYRDWDAIQEWATGLPSTLGVA
jgi:menaquinone-dependent protoporphyrinogen oxidase